MQTIYIKRPLNEHTKNDKYNLNNHLIFVSFLKNLIKVVEKTHWKIKENRISRKHNFFIILICFLSQNYCE